jgi:hypothetical protein
MKRAYATPEQHAAQSARERDSVNPHPAGSDEHDTFRAGWDNAVHKSPPGGKDRKHPAWIKGVVTGLSWRRRNPAL